MTLFHGSATGGITQLRPFVSNHGKAYVYLCDSEALATLYAHNALPRPNGWFPYWFNKDGQLGYDEYFPGQLEAFYQGQSGYVYTAEAELPRLDKMPWVHLSESPVDVAACRYIPDLLEELLSLEARGRLIIRRHETLPERMVETIRLMVLKEIKEKDLRSHPEDAYAQFIHAHYPELL